MTEIDSMLTPEGIEREIKRIKDCLKDAGIKHIDIVYDPENGKLRYYKRALALEGDLEDSIIKIAHVLGWHKFD